MPEALLGTDRGALVDFAHAMPALPAIGAAVQAGAAALEAGGPPGMSVFGEPVGSSLHPLRAPIHTGVMPVRMGEVVVVPIRAGGDGGAGEQDG
ncbi:MAG TPA: hypothetical protein VFA70_08650, partial [Dehalococcoidia bacterium]|nr:hypothetical protein [Dehalococcoidia bacterium]